MPAHVEPAALRARNLQASIEAQRALLECERLRVPSIAFTGRDGGRAGRLASHCIVVPGTATSTIQEQHIVLAHTLCECVETALFAAA
ncbi:MAG: hypothetical protein HS128_08460 [Ideonella sp.]|nr:hypothetical protein [Ideonella sp.]MCC7457881.1 hypothetical protein [Nitrospira sp.]